MPKSEIDDIFASKGKRKLAQPIASSSTAPPPPTKSKKNKKKRKTPAPHAESPSSPKRPAPETVVDPSTGGDSQPPPKRRKSVKPIETPAAKDKKNRPAEDDERFKDSRGTGPSQCMSFCLIPS